MDINEQDPTPLESTIIHQDDRSCNDTSAVRPASSQTTSYTEVMKSPGKWRVDYQQFSQRGQGSQNRRRGHYRGGRGSQSPSGSYFQSTPNRGQGRAQGRGTFNNRRPQDKLSADDKNFLFGYASHSRFDEDGYITPRKSAKSPTSSTHNTCASNPRTDYSNSLNLTEHQKNGLVELGLIPDSDFVKNIVSVAKKLSTAT